MSILVDTFVPVDLLDELKERIETIQKRARRIHFPEPVAEYLEVVTGDALGASRKPATAQEIDKWRQDGQWENVRLHSPVDWRHVVVSGEPLKLDGWSLVASIDGVEQKDDRVVAYFRPVPGMEVPEAFRQADPAYCGHCKVIRHRTETFLIGHDDGRYLQVGRQCIRDFLGWNPDALIPFLKLFRELKEWTDRDWAPRVHPEYRPEDILGAASRVVAHDGFYQSVAKKQAAEASDDYENNWSTKDRTILLIEPPTDKHAKEFQAEYNDEKYDESAKRILRLTVMEIEQIIQDNRQELEPSDWLFSLVTAYRAKYLKRHQLGVLASAVVLGLKRIEAEKEKKEIAAGPVSEYVGQIGDKLSTTVTVTDIRYVDNNFGGADLISMVDDNGNVIKTFFSGAAANPVVGARLDIRGTIKKHEEFKGRKSTVLTRYKWELSK